MRPKKKSNNHLNFYQKYIDYFIIIKSKNLKLKN